MDFRTTQDAQQASTEENGNSCRLPAPTGKWRLKEFGNQSARAAMDWLSHASIGDRSTK